MLNVLRAKGSNQNDKETLESGGTGRERSMGRRHKDREGCSPAPCYRRHLTRYTYRLRRRPFVDWLALGTLKYLNCVAMFLEKRDAYARPTLGPAIPAAGTRR